MQSVNTEQGINRNWEQMDGEQNGRSLCHPFNFCSTSARERSVTCSRTGAVRVQGRSDVTYM